MTELLRAWRVGDEAARSQLDAYVYHTLKRMARQRVRDAGASATLNATALVHEAVARMPGSETEWQSRSHFYALAALQMRAVLVDAARRLRTNKRSSKSRTSIIPPRLLPRLRRPAHGRRRGLAGRLRSENWLSHIGSDSCVNVESR